MENYSDAKPLRIRIINYEGGGWILTKFAHRLVDHLNKLGAHADIGGG